MDAKHDTAIYGKALESYHGLLLGTKQTNRGLADGHWQLGLRTPLHRRFVDWGSWAPYNIIKINPELEHLLDLNSSEL